MSWQFIVVDTTCYPPIVFNETCYSFLDGLQEAIFHHLKNDKLWFEQHADTLRRGGWMSDKLNERFLYVYHTAKPRCVVKADE
jgi:hypothetical protein